jgi:spore coat protein A
LSLTRRTFLQQASAVSLLGPAAFAQNTMAAMPKALQPPMLHAAALAPWVDPLPLPTRLHPHRGKLRIAMRETHARVHRDAPATRFWSYVDASNPTVVSPLIEARSHQPLQIEWINRLPTKHFLPIDHSLHGCGRELPEVRTVAHVHGARVPSKDDGYPLDWFVSGQSHTSTYPLEQDATALWFHDHAMGLNRLNTYAGLFGQLLVRDELEDALHLPSGPFEIPLTLSDRDIAADGQLFYPTSGDPEHPWVPEFYADAILVNGKIKPFLEVEPTLYRLRVLNVANSRFFSLSLSNDLPLHLIGADQGLLAAPVSVANLLVAPAERADILIDLSHSAGRKVYLRNGPVEILELRVAHSAPQKISIPTALRPIPPALESSATLTRTLTLDELQDVTTNPMYMLIDRKHWHEPVTERPRLGSTEIWEFVNMTEDTHPMHLHLVRFQVLDRRVFEPFDWVTYKKLRFLAPALPPDPIERGWKDVVPCPPGMVTRILVKFDGYAGRYLFHCHVLEHEANDMMRPFEVIA